jgi:GDP-D-mannose 3',5'-epimerase
MRVLVAGSGGALGGHLVKRLLADGHEVRAADVKELSDWWQTFGAAELFPTCDLSERYLAESVVEGMDGVFNLACDMGGMGFIETHRADCMRSVLINTHLLWASVKANVERYWYASSACVYAADKQDNPTKGFDLLKEEDAYPALPEAGYGEEKLFSEQMCRYVSEDYGLTTRIVRLHNVYGPYSTWRGGREKAPAAICRKVAEAKLSGDNRLDLWGDGTRTRSFLYVDDFVEGALRTMKSGYAWPVNLGSEEVVTINQLADLIEGIAGTNLTRVYDTTAPQGVYGRGSDNRLLRQVTGWEPSTSLQTGLEALYGWVEAQVREDASVARGGVW